MGFDSERFHLQQLASTQAGAMPFELWMSRCCSRLVKHVPGMTPDGVAALAHGLWLSHWFDDPEATADEAASMSPVERYLDPADPDSNQDGPAPEARVDGREPSR
jgi:hypothetical protein